MLMIGNAFAEELLTSARSPLLELLPKPSMPAQPAPVIAAQAIDVQCHLSGYRLHPALTDATLHLSAAALPAASTSSAKGGTTRVPSGLAAILVTPLGSCAAIFPVAQPQAPAADGSVLCSYRMASAQGSCLQLCDLLAKELAPMPAAQRGESAALDSVPESELLYETQWQAATSSLAGPSHSADALFALGEAVPGDSPTGVPLKGYMGKRREQEGLAGRFLALPAKSAKVTAQLGAAERGNAIGVVSRMLQLWQVTAPRLAGGALHLITPGVGQSAAGSGEGGVAAAALAALMRVAAAENPSVSITGSEQAVALPAHSQKVSKNLFCNSLLLTCDERILPQEHMRSLLSFG